MHKINLSLEGVVTDSVTVEFGDVEAFVLFRDLKKSLVGDPQAKRRGKRGTTAVTDESSDAEAPADAESGA